MAIHSSTLIPSSFGGAKHSKPKLLKSCSLPSNPPPLVSFPYRHRHRKALRISASVSVSNPEVRTGSDDLVASILSKSGCRLLLSSNITWWWLLECFGPPCFQNQEMIQVVDAPETVRNKVSFSAFGFLDGEVSLTGTLTALDDR
ncbi:probable plastid-lipid-associated protein 8, chloroplastic [Carya illinoinensis]|uniref:probable plastid-lipid-associated protein 8, chloroplastic n=1 Tax=Carya illinoinensis TaxID=32201 RepID=UPI001C71C0BB|nr:probable plastid-lipid-associated protein 8, chloroplastic [Carya illinoinensis]